MDFAHVIYVKLLSYFYTLQKSCLLVWSAFWYHIFLLFLDKLKIDLPTPVLRWVVRQAVGVDQLQQLVKKGFFTDD